MRVPGRPQSFLRPSPPCSDLTSLFNSLVLPSLLPFSSPVARAKLVEKGVGGVVRVHNLLKVPVRVEFTHNESAGSVSLCFASIHSYFPIIWPLLSRSSWSPNFLGRKKRKARWRGGRVEIARTCLCPTSPASESSKRTSYRPAGAASSSQTGAPHASHTCKKRVEIAHNKGK